MDVNDFQGVTKKWQPSLLQRLRWGDQDAWWKVGTLVVWVIVLLMLWFMPGCAHSSRAVTGMIGRQCAPEPRRVVCSTDMRGDDCDMVRDEVTVINRTVGRTLYRFVGWLPCDWKDQCLADALAAGDTLVVLRVPSPQRLTHDLFTPQTLAETRLMVDEGNGCIGPEFTALVVDERDQSYAERRLMVRHELLHALGVPHSNWPKSDSQMTPFAADANEVPPMAEADVNALRAIYQ